MTAADAVLSELRRHRREWVCARSLALVAGFRFGARIWDLRRAGHQIETTFPCRCERCEKARKYAKRRGRGPAFLGAYRLVEEAT